MCGIAGIISTRPLQETDICALTEMQQSMVHRGPDGNGHYLAPSGNAGLAHARLSIIDLSDHAAQPMSSMDGRYTITFNGEIYNYEALRERLLAQGESFESMSDTEVVLKLYQSMGADCVHQLRGMFAFFIWDDIEQTAFAARDPLGIKPLYYWHDDARLVVASELRTIIKTGFSKTSISALGLHSYLSLGTVAEPHTLIDDVYLLPAATTLQWRAGEVTNDQYWSLAFSDKKLPYDDAIRITRAALEDSVRAHFVSDVPVGIFLSGGIDSTCLVALAKEVTGSDINTYSIAFEDPAWNEGDIARRVARHFGTNHTELLMTVEQARPLFHQFLAAIDQPTIDGFNTFCVAQMASQNGEKVVLSGLGGDELFAGYKSFTVLPKMVKISKWLKPFSWIIRVKSRALYPLLSAKFRRLFDAISRPGSLRAAHTSLRGIFSARETAELMQIISQTDIRKTPNEPQQPTLADCISELELSTYLRNQLLRDSDVTSMAWGLELRVPFIDRKLIDEISSIPAELRLQAGKKLLTDSVPEIPEWVVNRPKQGFRFPFDQWFAEAWSDMAMPVDVPKHIKLKPWYRRWSLLVLNDWMNRHAR